MLSRRDIEKELGKGINIVPVIPSNFKENSINLTVSENCWTKGEGKVYYNTHGTNATFSIHPLENGNRVKNIKKGESCIITSGSHENPQKYVVLFPHSTTLIETVEVIGTGSNIGGALHSKVGVVAKGIGHIGTMMGPGYCGHLLISLHNITDDILTLKVGSTFVSLSFDYLTTSVIRTSTTVSGHVDKFAELGIVIDESTIGNLTEDWKSNLSSIREKMLESNEYKEYKKHITLHQWKEIRKYINWRNTIAIVAVIAVFVFLLFTAKYVDRKSGGNTWEERFWNVGLSGFVGSLLMGMFNFIKYKK